MLLSTSTLSIHNHGKPSTESNVQYTTSKGALALDVADDDYDPAEVKRGI
jgi:hypothetical protein